MIVAAENFQENSSVVWLEPGREAEVEIVLDPLDNAMSFSGNYQAVPVEAALINAYPNPFNSSTTVSVSIPELTNATLGVYDLNGRMITTLHQGPMEAGKYSFTLNGENLTAGNYVLRFDSADGGLIKQISYIK